MAVQAVEPDVPTVVIADVVVVAIVQPLPDVEILPHTSIKIFEVPSHANGVVNVCEFKPLTGE